MTNKDIKNFLVSFEARETQRHNDEMALLKSIAGKLATMSTEANESTAALLAAVQSETTLVGGVTALVTTLEQQITSITNGSSLSPTDQNNINAAFTAVTAQAAELTAALASNTPAAAVTPGATPAGSTTPTSATGS